MTVWEITDGPRKGAKGNTSPLHDDKYSRAGDGAGHKITGQLALLVHAARRAAAVVARSSTRGSWQSQANAANDIRYGAGAFEI